MSTIREHWPEYLIEAGCLTTFMVSAAFFATLLNHPASPVPGWIMQQALRRIPMGIAMGLTAIALIYSPAGQRSGAHMNPAVTLAFLRLGRIQPPHACAYIAAQFLGGFAGISAALTLFGGLPADPPVNYVATRPGPGGPIVAAVAEAVISFILMATVLVVSSRARTARFTGVAAGSLVALFIAVEDPLSGMSMNPARSLGPALLSGSVDHLWVYLSAPVLGMLAAADLFERLHRATPRGCAKLHHPAEGSCIFRCGAATPSAGPKEAAA